MNSTLGKAEQRSKIGQQKKFCCTLCTIKPSDEHGDETENIVSLQTVINVYHKYDTSLQIKQYQIIQCMYMRPMGWGPGYRGLYSTLPIPHCAKSILYVDYTEMPKFGGYDFALVVTCGLTRFTRVFLCTKRITGEETIKILLEEWFCVYGAPKEINSDEDVRVRSDTGWYKRVLRSLNVQVSTGIPYTYASHPYVSDRFVFSRRM